MRQDQRRASGAIDHAGGEDSEYTTMPFGVVEDNAGRGICTGRIDERKQCFVDAVQSFGLGVAPVLVEGIQLEGEGMRARRIAGEEELYDIRSDIHATGCIDAWSEAKANFHGRRCAIERNLCKLHERPQAWLHRVGKGSQAKCGKRAVLSGEWNRIGDCRDGDQLQKRGNQDGADAGEEGLWIGGERRPQTRAGHGLV